MRLRNKHQTIDVCCAGICKAIPKSPTNLQKSPANLQKSCFNAKELHLDVSGSVPELRLCTCCEP